MECMLSTLVNYQRAIDFIMEHKATNCLNDNIEENPATLMIFQIQHKGIVYES